MASPWGLAGALGTVAALKEAAAEASLEAVGNAGGVVAFAIKTAAENKPITRIFLSCFIQ